MSTIFSETSSFPIIRPSPLGQALPQWNSWRPLAAPWRLLQRWVERRAQRHALLKLTDQKHLLEDIGLTRAQVVREAARPFWQV